MEELKVNPISLPRLLENFIITYGLTITQCFDALVKRQTHLLASKIENRWSRKNVGDVVYACKLLNEFLLMSSVVQMMMMMTLTMVVKAI